MKELIISVLTYLVIILAAIGYVKDIVHFVSCDFESPYKAEILYGIGAISPPIGAVMGYIDIDDN